MNALHHSSELARAFTPIIRPDIDGALVQSLLRQIRDDETTARLASMKAANGWDVDTNAERADKAEQRISDARRVISSLVATAFPGIDQAELARNLG